MDNVEIPNWLKELPLAPVFRPTDTEFADPIAYISKIEKEASAFGICKVIPPLPKPSKRYVFNNLNSSLSKSFPQCSDLNFVDASPSNSLKRVSGGKVKVNVNDTEAKAVFTTRQQELGQASKRSRVSVNNAQQPAAQKQVWQSGEVYTLEQFESKSKAFSKSVLGKIKEVTPQVIEALFWKAVSEKPIYVEYANDVPGSGFGEPEGLLCYFQAQKRRRRRIFGQRHQGKSYSMQQDVKTVNNTSSGEVMGKSICPVLEPPKECANGPPSLLSAATEQPTKLGPKCSSGEVEGTAGWKLSNSPWNLQVIARSAGSLTRFMMEDIPGVTSPMVYIGMLFSWFAWHVEDHELHSLNFLHMGAPKTWYAVPGGHAFALEEVIRKQAYGGDIDHLAALKLLGEKTTLLSPELIIASGIPCCRLVQNPGEFVVTFPRAYHVGFSHGFNCGEAANFGTPQWLTIAKDAAVRRAAMDHLPMLSHQQLLYLLTMSFISRIPKSLLTGVRSSRLRDHLKKERELLVKKAFIDDVLKENNLLGTILRKNLACHAVLWHPDSLPSFTKESLSPNRLPLDSVITDKDDLSAISEKNATQDGLAHQLTSYMETVNDFYLDTDDPLHDFQVDSGTLQCAACGILGYPFMCVVQPSKKASKEIFPAGCSTKMREGEIMQEPESCYHHWTDAISATSIQRCNGCGLRPRIFCLEHAIRIEELLRPKGGARMLIICHSDFQKIKVNAAAIAEEIGATFNYKEVVLEFASKEELSFIDLAVDSEQLTDCTEDWTSKLGMNLSYSVKARTSCPSKNIEQALNLDYLLSVIAPSSVISGIQWCSRKSRTKRDSIYGKVLNLYNDNHLKQEKLFDQPGGNMEVKEKVLLQYSRKKYRIESRNYTGPKFISDCGMKCSLEVTDSNCEKIDHSEQDTLGGIVPHDEVEMAEINRKHAVDLDPTDVSSQAFDSVSPCTDRLSCEVMLTETLTSTSEEKMRVDDKATKGDEDLNAKNCCDSHDEGRLDIGKSRVIGDTNIRSLMAAGRELVTSSPVETSKKRDGGGLTLDHVHYTTCVAEITKSLVPEKAALKLDRCDHASSISEIQDVIGTIKQGCIPTRMDSSITTLEDIDMSTRPNPRQKDSGQAGKQAFSLLPNRDGVKVGKVKANAKMTSGNRSEGARVAQGTEAHSDFVRSPCEGLRPRKKHDLALASTGTVQQKHPAKRSKRSSGCSNSSSHKLMDGNKASYKCNIEGCPMLFTTGAALSLHKRNRCHHEECGKRFRSHKYLMLHQRVHEDERPFKCTWKGCGMTFKWAWARTEHLRLHTGERPYQCKVEGCGLTFRFVSDFSRHRRKTGHFVIPPHI